MKINQATMKLIKEFEGCHLRSYQDAVGVWTIGWGITSADRDITGRTIHRGMVITQPTAEKWLKESLEEKYLPKVMKYDHIYHWNENEAGALTSFAYNIGSIKELTKDGTRSKATIAKKMLLYNKADNKVLLGLKRRREAEHNLFLTPVKEETKPMEKETITYFKRYTGKHDGIVKILDAKKYDSSFESRKKIAELNGIKNYQGTAEQNEKMVKLIKAGKLIKKKNKIVGTAHALKFVGFLEKISKTYKNHPKNWVYSYAKAEKTYPKAKAKVEAGKTTGTTCVVPIKWALKLMGLNPDGFYGYKGGFRGFDSDLKKVMKKKSSGGPIGYTVKQAVNKGLLKTGDIIAFKGRTHTVVYSGMGYKVYEGGGAAKRAKYKTGILLDYSKVLTYRGRKISCICRWL